MSYLPPNHWAYNSALKDPGYDPARAAAMLDEAGWKVGSDGVREKDGVQLSFTMSTTAGNKSREQSQQFVQQNLKKINVDMTINNMPASVVWGDYTVKSKVRHADGRLGSAALPRPRLQRPHHEQPDPGQGRHRARTTSSTRTRRSTSFAARGGRGRQAERKEIYDRIQEILLDDLPFAPMFAYQLIMGTDKTGARTTSRTPTWPINSWNCNEWAVG